ncbi:hypothetical protein [Microbacterium sp. SORGH_AS_0888]|uniref:hypothetical protein n=1 Tax=Microbacterium sp. SORGH_AS_0888 TaxID=3041791 RepID=UPI00278702DF|nr:hypothetical protein [Microbacterium sp. SORGH_AS_0888]MDQ1127886.1 hypothetical protein [Microbacterium sp. SORGH_AS_0888]
MTTSATAASMHTGSRVERGKKLAALMPGWPLAAVLGGIISLIPLLFNHRFYYVDDTQTYSVGLWNDIGAKLLDGTLGWLNPGAWLAGNHALDAQHGLWSPILLAISAAAAHSANLGVLATAVKIGWLMAATVGAYLLTLTFVTRRRWALVGGVAAPLNGVTSYMDAPSWTVLLITLALLAFLGWSLRRIDRFTAIPACVFGMLVVGLGFAQSVIMAAVLFAAVCITEVLSRRWRNVTQILIAGAATALFALAVFLPGMLSSSVTFRDSSGVGNDELMGGSLGTFALGQFPTAFPEMTWSWGAVAPVPFAYVSWMLALAALLPWRRVWGSRAQLTSLAIVAVITALLLLGPTLIGPTRMPFRYYPLLSLTVAVLLAVGFSVADESGWRLTRSRLWIIVAILAWGGFATFSNAPSRTDALVLGLGSASIACACAVITIRLRRQFLTSALVFGCALVAFAQHAVFPSAPVYDFSLPSARADFQNVQSAAIAPSVVVGTLRNGNDETPGYTRELLLGNSWLLSNAGVQNLYSSLGRRGYSDTFCIDFLGQTCPTFLTSLFSAQPTTGQLLVDQLGINSVIVTADVASQRNQLLPTLGDQQTPTGWHVETRGVYTETWVRDSRATCDEGGITWQSGGVSSTLVSSTSDSVTIHVDAVSEGSGRVAFCRMQWPGFQASNGAKVLSIDGYLLGVEVGSADVGRDVTLSYHLPGEHVITGALVVTAVLPLASVLLAFVWRRRRDFSRVARN